MKVLNKYNLILIFLVVAIPVFANTTKGVKAMHEKTRNIVEEFDADATSDIRFNHRRGEMTAKYIDGTKGRIEAVVSVKGEDLNDVQLILDAMEVKVETMSGRVDITTEHNIKSWSHYTVFFINRHKIVLSDGREVTTKIDQVSITATLYLPKVNQVHLKTKYDDIKIESCKAENINVDIHSGKLRAGILGADMNIKVKYGELDLQQFGDLKLESHDSKGTIGNIGHLEIQDKYSDFDIGNISSLNASLHDGELDMGMIAGDANITDKYSEIRFGSMKNGTWNLHDSKIEIVDAGQLKIQTKYTEFVLKNVEELQVNAHDDDFNIRSVGILKIPESKYTEYDIDLVKNQMDIDYSHDDDFNISNTTSAFSSLNFNGKYTEIRMPLPSGKGYTIKGVMKYGDFRYPKDGLRETKYIKDDDNFELEGVAEDGKSGLLVNIEAHDCTINLQN